MDADTTWEEMAAPVEAVVEAVVEAALEAVEAAFRVPLANCVKDGRIGPDATPVYVGEKERER